MKSQEIRDASITDTSERISDEGLATSSAKYIKAWSVLVAMYGATLGKVALLKVPATVNQAICALETDPQETDHRWLYYSMKHWRPQLMAQAQGAAQQNLNQGLIKRFGVPTPELAVQRKIGAVLVAYDELIENNLRRIEILEEMSQATYREWFINFRFPGHEGIELIDSVIGPVPRPWDVATVKDTFEVVGGGTPSTETQQFWDGGTINWFTPSDLTRHGNMFMGRSERQITEAGVKGSSAKLFAPGCVMMTSRATLGVVAINTTEACTNQGFITCIPNELVSNYYLYFWLHENVDAIINRASGATFKEISKGVFKQIDVLVPPAPLMTAFTRTVEPLLSLLANLLAQVDNLRKTRDLLAPRLVSGAIDLSELDIKTSWVAA